MLKKILALFKIDWLCKIVNKGVEALASAKTVLEYVKSQLEGSAIGKKVIPYIEKLVEVVVSLTAALTSVATFVCGTEVVPAIKKLSIDDALANLDKIADELDKLVK